LRKNVRLLPSVGLLLPQLAAAGVLLAAGYK